MDWRVVRACGRNSSNSNSGGRMTEFLNTGSGLEDYLAGLETKANPFPTRQVSPICAYAVPTSVTVQSFVQFLAPTGQCPPAQGCAEGATLGKYAVKPNNPKGVAATRATQPLWGWSENATFTQGSSFRCNPGLCYIAPLGQVTARTTERLPTSGLIRASFGASCREVGFSAVHATSKSVVS